ncbi:MAG TPA: ISL3 family transposase [Candidatus Hodarchaeales archaeon]|nr:ISL3 family transposase [Candidatus Hodarchaeales archaeon]
MQVLESLFEKALKVESPWKITRIDFQEKEKRLYIDLDFPEGSLFPCPRCGKQEKAYDTKIKIWRHLNFFQYECYLRVRMPRTDCLQDGALRVEAPWARRDADFTLLFESFAMTLCREMPVNTVSRIIGVDDNKLWRMMRHYVEAAREKEDYSEVKRLGTDETSKCKGHDYVSLFVDLDEKKTIFVAEGKGSETVVAFTQDLKEHGGNPENITDVSIDMSPAFIKGVEENLKKAEITFDRFHVMKIINKAVDEVRKMEAREQDILRGNKYLFLKNRENLTDKQSESLWAIESQPRLNLKTVRAFHIRENFQDIYKEHDSAGFERALKKWYFWATHCRIPQIVEAAKTIKNHWAGVLRWFESKVSNGILEGLNSLVQAAKSKARGYRTFVNFKTIIYMLTGKLDYSKVGLPT